MQRTRISSMISDGDLLCIMRSFIGNRYRSSGLCFSRTPRLHRFVNARPSNHHYFRQEEYGNSLSSLRERISELDAPNTAPTAHTQPITALASQLTLRRPAYIANFIVAPPARHRSFALNLACPWLTTAIDTCAASGVQQVPD